MLIGDLARLSGLSKDGIRHYEEMGIVSSVPREAGSRIYREYDPANLDRIEKARQAQQLGLALKEIGPLLDVHESRDVTEAETITFLEGRLAVVQGRIAELRRMESFIEMKLSRHRAVAESSIASSG